MTKTTSLLKSAALLVSLLLWCGCGKPPMLVQKYLLDYPAPVVRAGAPLDASIRVQKFEVDEAFNSTAMVFRTSPYQAESYNYSRWRVNPGYMVADYLSRDLRDSRLFKAVLPAESPAKARFALEGGVAEIQELDLGETWQASLALNITLMDATEEDITRRVIFQKTYRAAEPLTVKTPAGLADAMSRAMSQLSAQIVTDVYQAAARRVSSKQKAVKSE